MEEKMSIHEKEATIQIHEWNTFTLKLLRNYSEYKNNGQHQPDTNNGNGEQTKTEKIILPPLNIEPTPIATKLFPDEMVIAERGEYLNTRLYQPILQYLINQLPTQFTQQQISQLIQEFYKKYNKKITTNSAKTYSTGYRKYMTTHNMIQEKDKNYYKFITKPEKQTEENIPTYNEKFTEYIQGKNQIDINAFQRKHPEITQQQIDKIILYNIKKRKIAQCSKTGYHISKKNT